MKTDLKTLQLEFEKVRMSDNYSEIITYCALLSNSNFIDFHYSLLNEKNVSNKMHQLLRRNFTHHGIDGEKFLIEKIKTEQDIFLKGDVLQMLGTYKYVSGKLLDETAQYARNFLQSPEDTLRYRAIIVLGWVGNASDVDLLAQALFTDINNQNRGWGASGMMQLFFHEPKIKNKVMAHLQKALETEQDYFTLACILASLQEIAHKKWGISSTGRPENEKKEQLDKAKQKAIKFLRKYFDK